MDLNKAYVIKYLCGEDCVYSIREGLGNLNFTKFEGEDEYSVIIYPLKYSKLFDGILTSNFIDLLLDKEVSNFLILDPDINTLDLIWLEDYINFYKKYRNKRILAYLNMEVIGV